MPPTIDARSTLARALASLNSLWVSTSQYALRSSESKSDDVGRFPAATAHTIIALGECGLLSTDKSLVGEIFGGAVNPWSDLNVADLAKSYVAEPNDDSWVTRWTTASSHGKSNQPRKLLILALVAQAAAHLAESGADLDEATKRNLGSGATKIVREVAEILPRQVKDGAGLANDPEFRPFLLLQALRALDGAGRILKRTETDDEQPDLRQQLKDLLSAACQQHLVLELAYSTSPTHPYQDLPGLLFSFAGLVHLDPEMIQGPLATPVIRGITDGQRADGCWSEGTAIVLSSGDVLQQSSMEVAVELVRLARPEEALRRVLPGYTNAVRPISRAAANSLSYCDRTFHSHCGSDRKRAGWSSDRTRWPNVAETWVTATVTRLAFETWQLERAIKRQDLLATYRVTSADTSHPHNSIKAFIEGTADAEYRNATAEPDQVLKPVTTVWKTFIGPLRASAGARASRPADGQRSFILAGPPGSGKTYFVKQMAKAIGWPLISLGPGTFITNGLERIEETASQVFRDLESLENVVVFLDECDELFRDRDRADDSPGSRTILSFATASMLPKLQELYDRGQIITVLATNYIDRIDSAIKRPGRFDRRILFDRPDQAARQRWAASELKLKGDRPADVARFSPGCTYKELQLIEDGTSVTETSAPEYVEWILKSGLKELDGCSPTPEQRRKVSERWLKVVEDVASSADKSDYSSQLSELKQAAAPI